MAVGLLAIAASGCTVQGAPPRASVPPTSDATPTAEYPGRSHPPRDPVAVFDDPADGTVVAPDDAARATTLALADPAVQARIAGTRYAILFVTAPPMSSSESKETDPQTLPEVIVYDYTSDRWLEIPVDLTSDSVHRFKERDPKVDGQPPIAPGEARVALKIALADAGVAALTTRGFQPVERPVRTGRVGGTTCVTARCVLVVLYDSATNRSAFIQVDLGAERVVGKYEE